MLKVAYAVEDQYFLKKQFLFWILQPEIEWPLLRSFVSLKVTKLHIDEP